jgi:enamine deaminase RidA (YjgF/YER057c/UK114 family)
VCPIVFAALAVEGGWSMQDRTDAAPVQAAAGPPYARPVVSAGGFIYVSGITSPDAGGALGQKDIQSQTGRVLDRLRDVLEGAGSSMAQAVSVNVYLSRNSDFQGMNDVYRERFAESPPARTTVVSDLVDGALIQVSAIAVPNGAPRETLLPAGWMKSPRPYSYIVRAGDLVFFSGLLSRRGTDDQVVPGGIEVQTKTILENADTLLRTAGLTLRDVAAARVYLTDDGLFQGMNDVYRTYFPSEPPARATAVTGPVSPGAIVEISFIASTVGKQVLGPNVSPSLPVSTAVRVGPRVFLAGVVGNTDTNTKDLAAQTREVFARIRTTLDLAGMTFTDVVDNTVYMADLWQRLPAERIYGEVFPSPAPARTLFGARMPARASLIEVIATAVK